MLTYNQIQQSYPVHLHPFGSFLLREYLQHKILALIFNSDYAVKFAFLGGTCLRIVHQTNRRDIYDITFLCAKTRPNYAYLEQRLAVKTPSELKELLLSRLKTLDLNQQAKDVSPFLFYNQDIQRILFFEQFITQTLF